jgi:hypothetical protein
LRTHYGASTATMFATVAGAADTYAFLAITGLSTESSATQIARCTTLDVSQVKAAAARWFDPHELRIAIVGDWEALRESLTSLRWGPIQVVSHDSKARIEGGTIAKP